MTNLEDDLKWLMKELEHVAGGCLSRQGSDLFAFHLQNLRLEAWSILKMLFRVEHRRGTWIRVERRDVHGFNLASAEGVHFQHHPRKFELED